MDSGINRRDFLITTAGAAGTAGTLASAAVAQTYAQPAPPPGFADQVPFSKYWPKQLSEVVNIDRTTIAHELPSDAVKERHRIYCHLLMSLIQRFWNGNKKGPIGIYPGREAQKEPGQSSNAGPFRYRGDMAKTHDPLRVSWDRYLGHNIACLAVDQNGSIIDFEFNHNDLFRSSAEHAESRMVRRLFSLTDDFDTWQQRCKVDGQRQPGTKSSRISLNHVTLYTSLESCAQCSGVMSLANIKRVIFLQNDFTAYMIGNIMFNLAEPGVSPLPIPASEVGVGEFNELNAAYLAFTKSIIEAQKNGQAMGSFFIPPPEQNPAAPPPKDPGPDFSPSITSFLCQDAALNIFSAGAAKLKSETLRFPDDRLPNVADSLTNRECLDEAKRFFTYADVEGFRGTPHKA